MRFVRPESGALAYLAAFQRQFRERLISARCPQVAGSLAFTTLLALVPLLTVALIVFGSLPGFAGISEALKSFLLQNLLPATAGKIIATYAVQFSQKATNLTLIGTSIVIVTAVMLILTIDRAFNQIWAVAHPRRMLARLSMYWVGLTLGPMALAAVVALLGQIASLSLGLVASPEQWFRTAVARATTLIVLSVVFSLMYLGLPNRPVRASHAIFGGVLAALLLTLLQRLFALYLAKFPTYALIYGTFAALPTFLLWLYLSWMAVLVAAVVVAVLPEVSARGTPARGYAGEHVLGTLQLLDELDAAQAAGHTPSVEALAARTGLGLARTATLLEEMVRAGWVVSSDAGHWLLSVRCDEIPLRRLLETLCISPSGLRAGKHPLGTALADRLDRLQGPWDEPVSSLLAAAREPPAGPDSRAQIG